MPELHISFYFRILLLVLAAVCSTAGALFVYRVTMPPVSSAKRYILMSLRALGLFLLFFLLGEPLLPLITHSVDQPVVAVLVDISRSMSIHDRSGSREEMLKSVLRSEMWKQIGLRGKIAYSLFDGKVRNISAMKPDSLTLRGEATDIAEALRTTKRTFASSPLRTVVLITDGNSTAGMNPLYEAEALGVPVFTIGIGDTSEQKDLLIRKILTNDLTFTGSIVPVHVTLHSAGYGGERVLVSLRAGTAQMDEKPIVLEPGIRDYLVMLSYKPEKEGTQKFTVEVSTLPGELTSQNNSMSYYVKILKSKLHVGLIAGAPSQDVAAVRRVLTSDKNIDVTPFIERNDGQLYETTPSPQVLNDLDCLVLIGFPAARTMPRTLQMVLDAASAGKPLLVILSRTMDFNRLHMLDPVLPFITERPAGNELQIFVSIRETQRNNPIVKIGTGLNTLEAWSKLPPIFQTPGGFRPKVESEVLAAVRLQTVILKEPCIIARNVNKYKSLAVLGYGIWRWNMLSEAGSGSEDVLENFIGNAVRWLTTQEDERRIRVQAAKNIFTTQDAVEFNAQVYDENYQPVDDAQIEVRAQRRGEVSTLSLTSLGSGQYQGAFDQLQAGDYTFTATVSAEGTSIGSDQGTFSIGDLQAKFIETRMNKPLLLQIASRTGGQWYDINASGLLSSAVTSLKNFTSQEISRSQEIEIWNSRWMLALVIAVFALEWLMRKWHGML